MFSYYSRNALPMCTSCLLILFVCFSIDSVIALSFTFQCVDSRMNLFLISWNHLMTSIWNVSWFLSFSFLPPIFWSFFQMWNYPCRISCLIHLRFSSLSTLHRRVRFLFCYWWTFLFAAMAVRIIRVMIVNSSLFYIEQSSKPFDSLIERTLRG